MNATREAVLVEAATELARSYQEWADMHYEIARQCPSSETQEAAAEYSKEARKFLFALIGAKTKSREEDAWLCAALWEIHRKTGR